MPQTGNGERNEIFCRFVVYGTWLDDEVEHLINPVVVDSCETPDLLDFRCGIWRVQDGMETIWKALKHGKKCIAFVSWVILVV